MGRLYKRKTEGLISESDFNKAVEEVLKKKLTYRQAATKYSIKNHETVYYRVKKAKELNPELVLPNSGNESDSGNDSGPELVTRRCADKAKFRHNQVFSDSEEIALEEYIKRASAINHGLICKQARELAYRYAAKLCKSFPSSWEKNKEAGKDWMLGFMKRHGNLSLRKAENTSLARASAFNKTNVDEVFDNYMKVMNKYKFSANRIYNIDETEITTVLQAPKVIAEKRKRQVGQIVSAERGELVIFCGIINALGHALPPVFIFPRVRVKEHFLHGAPTGSVGFGAKSGWMTADIFLEVLKHIKMHTQCSTDSPILLILDNHVSHCGLDSIIFAKTGGIVMLSFPPHCSHRMQPLDIGVYGPFKSALKVAFNDFMCSNPGQLIKISDVPKLSNLPFLRTFTPHNITSSFLKPGIWPINRLVFADEDFLAAFVTDRPIDTNEIQNTGDENDANVENLNVTPPRIQCTTNKTLGIQEEQPSCSSILMNIEEPLTNVLDLAEPAKRNLFKENCLSPEVVRPFPKAPPRKNKTNKQRGKSRIYTETPEKNRISMLEGAKQSKILKKLGKTKKKLHKIKKEKEIAEVPPETESSSNSETAISLHDHSSDIFSEESDNESKNKPKLLLDDEVIHANNFVLVKFSDCKKFKKMVFYVGRVQKVYNAVDFDVKFLRKKGNSFVFPKEDDISYISSADIESLLPKALNVAGTVRASGYYRFDIDFTSYNLR